MIYNKEPVKTHLHFIRNQKILHFCNISPTSYNLTYTLGLIIRKWFVYGVYGEFMRFGFGYMGVCYYMLWVKRLFFSGLWFGVKLLNQ